MGHALGFISAVDDVDRAGESGTAAIDQLQPLDLFRLEPGDGAVDFTGSPRALDPSLIQVFYDGGTFDPVGIEIARLQRGDIPMSTGPVYGDGGRPVTGKTT